MQPAATTTAPAAAGKGTGRQYEDFTDLLREGSKELGQAELLIANHFTLQDAVQAISIMDPRMDTGVNVPNADRGHLAVAGIADKTEWSLAEITAICDQLIAREMSWLSGQLVAQTVFTCIYMHDIPMVSSTILRTFMQALIRHMALARAIIMKEQIYFEEDFWVDLASFSLDESAYGNHIERVYTTLISNVQAVIDSGAQDDKLLQAMDPYVVYGTDAQATLAMTNRLLDRLVFLQNATQLAQHMFMVDLDGIAQSIPKTRDALAAILKTPIEFNTDAAFDQLVNRKRFAQCPPCQASKFEAASELNAWMALLGHVETVATWPVTETAATIMETAERFTAKAQTTSILVKSFMHRIFVQDESLLGKTPMQLAVRDLILSTVSPPYSDDMGERIREIFDLIVSRCAEAFEVNLKLFCYNRARQRRRLVRVIENWELAQQELEAYDLELHETTAKTLGLVDEDEAQGCPYYFSSWIYTQKLSCLSLYYSMGFELELYSVNEYPMIFWYLNYLHANLADYVARIHAQRRSGVDRQPQSMSVSPTPGTLGAVDLKTRLVFMYQLETSKKLIDLGLLHITRALRAMGLLDIIDFGVYSESVHYQKRFKLMGMLASPTLLQVGEYLEFVHHSVSRVPEFVESATLAFQSAKQQLEVLLKGISQDDRGHDAFKEETQSLIKVCISNMLSARTFPWSSSPRPSETPSDTQMRIIANQRRVLFEFKYHPAYPVLVRSL
ncbi:Mak10 subunit, NatC N-terminal acetyltransferase-domain-containing protein [Entophlyctis helioformis]|nr:Mak10 subunit, NatC N-terminal acetyltransferase-domain-containing protein [Entophlyctis helioformis]